MVAPIGVLEASRRVIKRPEGDSGAHYLEAASSPSCKAHAKLFALLGPLYRRGGLLVVLRAFWVFWAAREQLQSSARAKG